MPSVSKRISIAWDGGEPYEDTDTLVIVGNTYFVDVRVKKETGELDWAMAGVKEWVHRDSEPPRARFTPSLTSRLPPPGNPSSSVDEGTFSELPNGDSLETGVMYDPEDGKFKPYQEIWRDLPASGAAFILESVGDLSEFGNPPEARKTWVAMMGEFQLMVERLAVETYNAWAVSRETDGGWKTLSHTGDLVKLIPPVNYPDSPWKVGDTVTASGREWIVKEFFSIACTAVLDGLYTK